MVVVVVGGGEYIYTYTTDMEPNIILYCIETKGGLHEHYTHKISNSLSQSQTKSEIIFIYSVSVVVEILNYIFNVKCSLLKVYQPSVDIIQLHVKFHDFTVDQLFHNEDRGLVLNLRQISL